MHHARAGFTIIELLVVIAIIGMLASIIMVSLSAAKAKGRDARRLADLKSIQVAATLFSEDTGGPPGGAAGWWAQLSNSCAAWQPGPYTQLQPGFFPTLPEDPSSTGAPPPCTTADGYWYYYGRGYHWDGTNLTFTGNANQFVVCSKLESTATEGYAVIGNPWNGAWKLNYCIGN
jgi:prepilin-type N-terminal cleavage/methylation domain-containing protein